MQARDKEVLIETDHCVCILGLHGNEGSGPTLLVVSKAHYENLYDIPNEILVDAIELVKRVALLMRSAFKVDGTIFWQHNEPSGNQDV
ncbi:HIT domain-containing protein [Saccharospirillum alexandrii]|uniref:HIT domain-containing protein n=1 Tax=Saccharospirillum alexandrii TaxID=2448477 RepID=UPI0013DF1D3C|nr:HIT domain-containing protein [Saccharospirillum alexandrii]